MAGELVVINSELTFRVSYSSVPLSAPTVESINSLNVHVSLGSATQESAQVYRISWTPTVVGEFIIRFTADFTGASSSFITNIDLIVVESLDNIIVSSTLGEDRLTYFLAALDPMFLDTDQFILLYPDANEIEIAELIYFFSQEAISIIGDTTVTPLMKEFVQASVGCALNRIYDISAGADESTLSLGDLTITRRSSIKDRVTRANATTWCELAAVLRLELYRFANHGGLKTIVKGDRVRTGPIDRTLQRAEWRSF